ncbi:unnamed protein product [Prorocentrum cordatum]|uniref:Uncharacterized protein n=1 Tax=Prorocentrum cordatum TaxID=2364126 RepID=A0ABN9UFY3_9DINO|nr:unnamed protein product [Polarella glacialis]
MEPPAGGRGLRSAPACAPRPGPSRSEQSASASASARALSAHAASEPWVRAETWSAACSERTSHARSESGSGAREPGSPAAAGLCRGPWGGAERGVSHGEQMQGLAGLMQVLDVEVDSIAPEVWRQLLLMLLIRLRAKRARASVEGTLPRRTLQLLHRVLHRSRQPEGAGPLGGPCEPDEGALGADLAGLRCRVDGGVLAYVHVQPSGEARYPADLFARLGLAFAEGGGAEGAAAGARGAPPRGRGGARTPPGPPPRCGLSAASSEAAAPCQLRARASGAASQSMDALEAPRAALPPCALAVRAACGRIKYDDLDFKHAPKWPQAHRFRLVIDRLLDLSGGYNILSTSMINGFKKYSLDNGMDLSKSDCDHNSYAIRAAIAQMANHKHHERGVPSSWQRYFEAIYDKVRISERKRPTPNKDDTARSPSIPSVMSMAGSSSKMASPTDALQVCSSPELLQSSQEHGPELFESVHAVVASLLKQGDEDIDALLPPCATPAKKHVQGAWDTSELSFSPGALAKLSEGDGDIAPGGWRDFNKDLKDKKRKLGTISKKPSARAKKRPAATQVPEPADAGERAQPRIDPEVSPQDGPDVDKFDRSIVDEDPTVLQGFLHELESMTTIFAAWLVQVGDHRYTESLRQAINELALESSILASIGEEAQQGRVHDPISCGTFGVRMMDLMEKRTELKTTVEGHINPKVKVVKRHPSDEITEPKRGPEPLKDLESSPEAAGPSDGEEHIEDSQLAKAKELLADAEQRKRAQSSMVHFLQAHNKKEQYDHSPDDVKKEFMSAWFAQHLAEKRTKATMKQSQKVQHSIQSHHQFTWMSKQTMINHFGEQKTNDKISSGKLEVRADPDSGPMDEWNAEYKIWNDSGGRSDRKDEDKEIQGDTELTDDELKKAAVDLFNENAQFFAAVGLPSSGSGSSAVFRGAPIKKEPVTETSAAAGGDPRKLLRHLGDIVVELKAMFQATEQEKYAGGLNSDIGRLLPKVSSMYKTMERAALAKEPISCEELVAISTKMDTLFTEFNHLSEWHAKFSNPNPKRSRKA